MPKRNLPHTALPQQPSIRWPCRPVIGGSWRAVRGALRTSVLNVAPPPTASDPFALRRETVAMRCLPIEALPHAYLVEVLAARRSGIAGIFRFMLGPEQVVPLLGHGANLGCFVAATPPGCIATEGVEQYIQLFTSTLRAPDGRFLVVQSPKDVVRARPGAARRGGWRKHVRPMVALGEVGDGLYRYEGTMAYGEQLSWVRLAVAPDGQVNMEDDEPLAPLEPAPVETFAGAWQIFAPESGSPFPGPQR